jgi:hypothetical protein
MSVRLMTLVFSCNMPELKTDDGKTVPDSTAKFVLLSLADHANDEGEGSYPGVDRLCKKTNLSTATVCNALNALRTNGFTHLEGKSKRDTNEYTILVAKILEFQWLKSADFSGYNPSVLAAKTNPSLEPSIKPSIDPITHSLGYTKAMQHSVLCTEIESAIKVQFGMEATSTKNGMKFVDHAAKKTEAGEHYQTFLDYWKSNGGDRKYWSFNRMIEMWPTAFSSADNASGRVQNGLAYL